MDMLQAIQYLLEIYQRDSIGLCEVLRKVSKSDRSEWTTWELDKLISPLRRYEF